MNSFPWHKIKCRKLRREKESKREEGLKRKKGFDEGKRIKEERGS